MVRLSTGLSNDSSRSSYEIVKKQIQLLKKAGARVEVFGVANNYKGALDSSGKKFAGEYMNETLGKIVKENGAKFLGGFISGSDKIHPKSYSSNSFSQQPMKVTSADVKAFEKTKNDASKKPANSNKTPAKPPTKINNMWNPLEVIGKTIGDSLASDTSSHGLTEKEAKSINHYVAQGITNPGTLRMSTGIDSDKINRYLLGNKATIIPTSANVPVKHYTASDNSKSNSPQGNNVSSTTVINNGGGSSPHRISDSSLSMATLIG